MTATILCGRTASRFVLESLREEYAKASLQQHFKPCLHILKANDRADTKIYIRQKLKTLACLGFGAHVHDLWALRKSDIVALIDRLNSERDCHGILVQSPIELSTSLKVSVTELASLIDPQKDVDGLSPVNMGRLVSRSTEPYHFPCTPLGIVSLLSYYSLDKVAGLAAVVVGRSDIVGAPLSLLLNRLNATVTICHSKTQGLPSIISRADLLIAAMGKPNYVKGAWIKPGAVVIDVGINRQDAQLVGDVEFEVAKSRALAITPVPGGVGPMTVAMLARNLYIAALRREGVKPEDEEEEEGGNLTRTNLE